jgi:hypothetical protein
MKIEGLYLPGYLKDVLTPLEIVEWEKAYLEIKRLAERVKVLKRRAEARYQRGPNKKNVAQLRKEMIAAHPDKGGNDEAFIIALRLYREARAQRSYRVS